MNAAHELTLPEPAFAGLTSDFLFFSAPASAGPDSNPGLCAVHGVIGEQNVR